MDENVLKLIDKQIKAELQKEVQNIKKIAELFKKAKDITESRVY